MKSPQSFIKALDRAYETYWEKVDNLIEELSQKVILPWLNDNGLFLLSGMGTWVVRRLGNQFADLEDDDLDALWPDIGALLGHQIENSQVGDILGDLPKDWRARAAFLEHMLEDEFCPECGGDAIHHTVETGAQGEYLYRCLFNPHPESGELHRVIRAYREEQ